jgi:hypothetical protein
MVFYRDVAPGTYEVEVRSEELYPNQFKTVRLAPGSITFAKIQQPSWGKSASTSRERPLSLPSSIPRSARSRSAGFASFRAERASSRRYIARCARYSIKLNKGNRSYREAAMPDWVAAGCVACSNRVAMRLVASGGSVASRAASKVGVRRRLRSIPPCPCRNAGASDIRRDRMTGTCPSSPGKVCL